MNGILKEYASTIRQDSSMKRYCQTLTLKDDPELIAAYAEEHKHVWPEIREGFREIGILDMEIYLRDNLLFMIVDTVDGFDWERDYGRLGELPRQMEWEEYMSKYQVTDPHASPSEKWRLMERIFKM